MLKHEVVITEERTKLISDLYEIFGEDLFNQEKTHITNPTELKKVYDVINSDIFENKLPNDIKIEITRQRRFGKGYTDMCSLNESNELILNGNNRIIYCIEEEDIILEIIDTIGHEMIHVYDILFGKVNDYLNREIKVDNNRQPILDYDTHGDFFDMIADKFYEQGIYISKKKYPRMRYFMDEDKINETENDTLTFKDKMKRIFDGLDNGTEYGTIGVIMSNDGKSARLIIG